MNKANPKQELLNNSEIKSNESTNPSILELKASQVIQGAGGFDFEGAGGSGFFILRVGGK